MTENSNASTQHSPDTINVLPILSEAKAPISLTLTIDRSVGKIAAWLIGLIVSLGALVGAGVVMAVWMTTEYQQSERESRMVEYYIHELDGKLIAAGFIKPSQAFDKERIQRELEKEKQK